MSSRSCTSSTSTHKLRLMPEGKLFRRGSATRSSSAPTGTHSLPYSLPYSPRAPIQPAVLQRPNQALTCPTRLHAVATARLRPVYGSSRQRPGENFSAEPPQRGGRGTPRRPWYLMYGRAFLIHKLIKGRPARNQTILKSSIMCMGEHFFFVTDIWAWPGGWPSGECRLPMTE